MPLTDSGWVELTEEDALTKLQTMWREVMGPEWDLSPHSPEGQLLAEIAKRDVEVDQRGEVAYNNGHITDAVGVSLDLLGPNYGVERKAPNSAQVQLQITGEPGYLIDAKTEFISNDGTVFINAYDTQIGNDGTAELTAYSEDEAAYVNVDANTVTDPVNPVDEIFTVTNKNPATGGADLEMDYDYRRRMTLATSSEENGTVNGLRVAMLNLPAVTDAKIIANRSDTVDEFGNPAHTVHVYVMGGDPDDIAQKLLEVGGGETTFVGSIAKSPLDDSGHAQDIRFDVEQQVTVKFKITIESAAGVDREAINQSIIDYLETKEMGDDVIINQIYGYLYQLTGVDKVDSIEAGLGDTLGTDDVVIDDYQLARTTEDAIEVTINGD